MESVRGTKEVESLNTCVRGLSDEGIEWERVGVRFVGGS